jgi:hypothetical protein
MRKVSMSPALAGFSMAGLCLIGVGGQASAANRPNVVVIMSDDVGWGDLGSYGGGVTRGAPAPNLAARRDARRSSRAAFRSEARSRSSSAPAIPTICTRKRRRSPSSFRRTASARISPANGTSATSPMRSPSFRQRANHLLHETRCILKTGRSSRRP